MIMTHGNSSEFHLGNSSEFYLADTTRLTTKRLTGSGTNCATELQSRTTSDDNGMVIQDARVVNVNRPHQDNTDEIEHAGRRL